MHYVLECGAIVNPKGLRNQVEGAIIQGLGGKRAVCHDGHTATRVTISTAGPTDPSRTRNEAIA